MPKRRPVKNKASPARSRKAPPARAVRSNGGGEKAASADDFTFEEPPAPPPMQWVEIQCPYCGEHMDIRIDPSEEGQVLVQDCAVCCKPVELAVEVEEGEVSVAASRG